MPPDGQSDKQAAAAAAAAVVSAGRRGSGGALAAASRPRTRSWSEPQFSHVCRIAWVQLAALDVPQRAAQLARQCRMTHTATRKADGAVLLTAGEFSLVVVQREAPEAGADPGDHVDDVALAVDDVDAAYARAAAAELLTCGGARADAARALVEPTAMGGGDGGARVRYACVPSPVGRVRHTLVSAVDLAAFEAMHGNVFLPGFAPAGEHDALPAHAGEEAGPAEEGAATLSTHLDHYTVACPVGSMLAILSWYEAALGFSRYFVTPGESESDGMVVHGASSGLKLMAVDWPWRPSSPLAPRGKQYITFVEPVQGEGKSQVQVYIDENCGDAGVQHLAMHAPNIFEAVRAWRKNGVSFQKLPDAYYNDAIKRRHFEAAGFPDPSPLREDGILLDLDERPSFQISEEVPAASAVRDRRYLMQIFTAPVLGKFTLFMELIQREGARGFGHGNVTALFRAVEAGQKAKVAELVAAEAASPKATPPTIKQNHIPNAAAAAAAPVATLAPHSRGLRLHAFWGSNDRHAPSAVVRTASGASLTEVAAVCAAALGKPADAALEIRTAAGALVRDVAELDYDDAVLLSVAGEAAGVHDGIPSRLLRAPDAPDAVRARCSEGEWSARVRLAALYRVCASMGWRESIYNHVSLRVPGTETFLINPFGLAYEEITASSLLKVDLDGQVLDEGSTIFPFNQAGYVIHSAVHAARRDVNCVMHNHQLDCSAVASMACGLLPMCQQACIVGDVAYHNYEGIAVDEGERARLGADLGARSCMLLRNHGVLTVGKGVEDAWFLMFNLVLACRTQCAAMKCVGQEGLHVPSDDAQAAAAPVARKMCAEGFGVREFAAEVRLLEREGASFRA